MKKILSTAFVIAIAVIAAVATTLSLPTTWTVAGSSEILGVTWDPSASQNDMTLSTESGYYYLTKRSVGLEAGVNYEYKICADHSWAECYPTNENQIFTVEENGLYDVTFYLITDPETGNVTIGQEAVKTGDFTPGEKTWTVAGVSALMGSEWEPADVSNDMTKTYESFYMLVKKNVWLEAYTDYEYKVCANHSWNESYPISGNASFSVNKSGTYDVTFIFNHNKKDVTVSFAKSEGSHGGETTGFTETFQMDGSLYGLSLDMADIPASHIWYQGSSMTVSNPFATQHRTVSCGSHGYNSLTIGQDTIYTHGGVQGSDNPKDADSGNPALTLAPPVSGGVVQINANADGWMYVVGKLSSNKQYMVFEEGAAIGYKLAMEISDDRFPNNILSYEVKGSGEFNNVTLENRPNGVNWAVREALGDTEATTAGSGLGVISFPVFKDCKYYIHACGSKISWCGVCYSQTEAGSIKLNNDDGSYLEIATAGPATDNKSEAYHTLYNQILSAQSIENTVKLTSKGYNLLDTAIATAQQALTTEDDAVMTAATAELSSVVESVLKQEVLITETFVFNNYVDYYSDNYTQGQYAKVVPAVGNGGSYPYSNGSYLYWYSNNTLTINSDIPMVDITFDNYYNYTFSCSTGQMAEYNHWTGDAQEVTFTNDYGKTNRIRSITITFDNPSNETLIARIASQIEASTAALQALTYGVPGKAELEALMGEAATLTVENETSVLKEALKQLKEQTAAVTALDSDYQMLAALIERVETIMQNNTHADATIAAEATAKAGEVRGKLAEGAYATADIRQLTNLFNGYATDLSNVYITIHVTEPGNLAAQILESGIENFSDVYGLRVSGNLNTEDMTTLKSRLTSMQVLDLQATSLYYIANNQFENNTMLRKVILPANLQYINNYAFSGCTKLSDVSMPASLKTIGNYAFYNCISYKDVIFPEGLTSIGNYAFYCDQNGYYDENDNYQYRTGCIKELTLPASLTNLGERAFGYQTSLENLTIVDGLQTIGYRAFYGCTALKNLTLPATLTTIGSEAFYNCRLLQHVDLPEGLTAIGYSAFSNCSSLNNVVLPSTLQSISHAFSNCSSLTTMTAKAVVPAKTASDSYSNYAIMDGMEAQCTLTVPSLSVNAYKLDVNWGRFNIVGGDILPEDIYVNTDYRLAWPETIGDTYNPNVTIYSDASLNVTGSSILSARNFEMYWSANDARYNTYYDEIAGKTAYNRDNCYAALLNNSTVRADNIRINLYTRANVWDFISMPFDIKVSDIAPVWEGTPFVVRRYDGEKRAQGLTGETWVNMDGESTLEAGKGYIWQSASTSSNRNYNGFLLNALQTVNKNNIFASGDVDVALNNYESEFEHNRSWNLIGNPYPAYYDIRAMQTTAPITVWNTYNNNYQAYSPQDDAYILNPGQAFFVQRPVDEEKITFLKEGRQIDMNIRNIAYSRASRAKKVSDRTVFNITLSGNDMSDRTRLVVNPAAKFDYETARDASKFMSEEQPAAELYTLQNSVRYAINERPFGDGLIELGMQIGQEGTYTIALTAEANNEVYLIDLATGQETRLDGTEGYTFTTGKGTIEGRFMLRLGDGEATGIQTIDRLQKAAETYYDLNGVRVARPGKGIYIQNGKKVVVK